MLMKTKIGEKFNEFAKTIAERAGKTVGDLGEDTINTGANLGNNIADGAIDVTSKGTALGYQVVSDGVKTVADKTIQAGKQLSADNTQLKEDFAVVKAKAKETGTTLKNKMAFAKVATQGGFNKLKEKAGSMMKKKEQPEQSQPDGWTPETEGGEPAPAPSN